VIPAIVRVETARSGAGLTIPSTIAGGVDGTIVPTGAGFSSTAIGAYRSGVEDKLNPAPLGVMGEAMINNYY
jgi:hypothetical protein